MTFETWVIEPKDREEVETCFLYLLRYQRIYSTEQYISFAQKYLAVFIIPINIDRNIYFLPLLPCYNVA